MRQTRLSLNNDMTRVAARVPGHRRLLRARVPRREHAGLIVLDATAPAAQALLAQFPAGEREHTLFVVDPLGNLMMSYDARAESARPARGPEEAAAAVAHRLKTQGSDPTCRLPVDAPPRHCRRAAVLRRRGARRLRAPDRRGPGLPRLARLLRAPHARSAPRTAPTAQAAFPDRPLEVGKAWREMIHRYAVGTLSCLILALAVLAVRTPPAAPGERAAGAGAGGDSSCRRCSAC